MPLESLLEDFGSVLVVLLRIFRSKYIFLIELAGDLIAFPRKRAEEGYVCSIECLCFSKADLPSGDFIRQVSGKVFASRFLGYSIKENSIDLSV